MILTSFRNFVAISFFMQTDSSQPFFGANFSPLFPLKVSRKNHYSKMSSIPYDTSPNPGDEENEPITKTRLIRKRCTARTNQNRICRNNVEKDCRYCKMHGEMYRIIIPTYQIPCTQLYMQELRPCPFCYDNITYGQKCSTCIAKESEEQRYKKQGEEILFCTTA